MFGQDNNMHHFPCFKKKKNYAKHASCPPAVWAQLQIQVSNTVNPPIQVKTCKDK